ncbi:hypothetical protein PMI41_02107 [Phyllobacterium sp. YR531]|nr:hypothetical protein PMI41_02107 [Phyllobacterium sp. YR531]
MRLTIFTIAALMFANPASAEVYRCIYTGGYPYDGHGKSGTPFILAVSNTDITYVNQDGFSFTFRTCNRTASLFLCDAYQSKKKHIFDYDTKTFTQINQSSDSESFYQCRSFEIR